jgi:hypothetical protein
MMIAGYVPRRGRCVRSLATVVLGCVAVQMAKSAPADGDPREALIARLEAVELTDVNLMHVRLPEAVRRLEADIARHWTGGPPPRIVLNPDVAGVTYTNHMRGFQKEVEATKREVERYWSFNTNAVADREVVFSASRISARNAIEYASTSSDTFFRLHDDWIEFNPPGPRVAVTAYRFPIRDMLDELFPPGTTNVSKFFTSGGPGAFMFYERDRLFVAVPEDELPMYRAVLDALNIRTNGVPVKPVPLTEP